MDDLYEISSRFRVYLSEIKLQFLKLRDQFIKHVVLDFIQKLWSTLSKWVLKE